MEFKCIECDKNFNIEHSGFVCFHCGYLNNLPEIDYFSYLCLPLSLEIDASSLEAIYLKLIQIYHPDKYVSKTEREKSHAVLHSGYLNSAYEALKDPLTRVNALYNAINKSSIMDEAQSINDNNLMSTFFDLFEELENLDKNSINKFKIKITSLKQSFFEQLYKLDFLLQKQDVKDIFVKLKYVERLTDKLLAKEKSF